LLFDAKQCFTQHNELDNGPLGFISSYERLKAGVVARISISLAGAILHVPSRRLFIYGEILTHKAWTFRPGESRTTSGSSRKHLISDSTPFTVSWTFRKAALPVALAVNAEASRGT
jgi:hypothetical protein